MSVLLPDDSPLRNPPFNLDPVQKASWDAARFAFDMTHVSYLRLVAVLEDIGQIIRQQKQRHINPRSHCSMLGQSLTTCGGCTTSFASFGA
jgi:hypothetical protein